MGIANISGNILTDSGTNLSSLVSGSGTTNYLPKFTGASTLGDSVIQEVSGNIGIGGSPSGSYKLDVTGTGRFTSTLLANGISSIGQEQAFTFQRTTGTASDLYSINADSGSAYLYNNTTSKALMTWLEGGNVGIGTSSPALNLHIFTSGTSFTSSTITYSSATSRGILLDNSAGTSQSGNGIWFANSGLYSAIASTRVNTGNWGTDLRFYTHPDETTNQFDVTERMRITSGGGVLIGTTTDSGYKLDVVGQSIFRTNNSTTVAMQRTNGDGIILAFFKDSTVVGSISTNSNSLPSDLNFKKNINNLELGLNLITKLRPVSYNHKIDDEGAALSTGFIAQELEQSLTELGVEQNQYYILQHQPNEDETQSQYWLDYTKMIPVLVKAIQEQQEIINELSAKVTALENK